MAEARNNRHPDEKRFVEVNVEPSKILPPLPQISQVESISTLLDAIQSSEHLVKNLRKHALAALKACTSPKDQLTQDQSAALYLYSMQWPEGEHSFFMLFNRALRHDDRNKLVPYYGYFKLFMSALKTLPSEQKHVWRGIVGDLTHQYRRGTVHVWWAASSCTDEVHVTGEFLSQIEKRTLFSIKCYEGKVIKNHSQFPGENETLLPPGTYLKVISSLQMSTEICLVQLEQIPPDPNLITKDIPIVVNTSEESHVIPFVVWCDQSVDESSENKEAQGKLRDIFANRYQSFQSEDRCREFIHENGNYSFVIIVSEQMGRQLVPNVHPLDQVTSIYVYCMNKEANEKWAKNYAKVKAVIERSADLLEEMEKEKVHDDEDVPTPQPEHGSNDNTDTGSNQFEAVFSEYKKYPLTSLEEALVGLHPTIPQLDAYIHKAKQSSSNHHADGLTKDESAAIYLYTMEFHGPGYSLYKLLKEDLRAEQRENIRKWFPYLKLFLTALDKLPDQQCTVWRGVRADISKDYPIRSRVVSWTFLSTTASLTKLESVGMLDDDGVRTILSIKYEDEILLLPGFQYEILSTSHSASNLRIIHLKEITSKDTVSRRLPSFLHSLFHRLRK